MASQPPTTGAGSDSARISPAEFAQALREAIASMQAHGFGPLTVRILDLRLALRARVKREEFDQGLRRLQEEGRVGLVPHAHPQFLRPHEVRDALSDGESVLYLLRWLK